MNRAILLTFNGDEPSVCAIAEIAACVGSCCGTSVEDIHAFTFNEDEIAANLTARVCEVNFNRTRNYSEADASLIYIGEIFKKTLSMGDTLTFATELGAHVTAVKFTNSDPKLLAAVKIVASFPREAFSMEVRTKYHISTKAIEIIQRIGSNV